ncbi:protein translocase subunit SecF [Kangiella koreensis]|uniref:Protein-export membrane protein SecF n=1 Tax=Kangiella koreensis (strain DSM 16069 / JCM 12317 / KCTC 12182 / SW-125) TaxID=523791 RepID=C7RB48_KANKD|nr:protein translocase subunit SecF [Kangiella koreensis]ACV26490.1 protein-export membrane protein SecF [Kangiella koreensis DSM 16069]
MSFLNEDTNYDFLKVRKFAFALSAILIIASIVSFFTKGLNYGLDFTGGTLVEVSYEQDADLQKVRQQLTEIDINGAVVQNFGSAKVVQIRMPQQDHIENAQVSDVVLATLASDGSKVTKRDQSFVGPVVGEELKEQGGLAMIVALICIMIYVALRFEWKFSVGSVAALAHDVIIVVGFFSITSVEFDLTVLAALLAVIGYSLNDTIVVFDRIRENFLLMRKATPEEVINNSINLTLSRTVMTSLTTMLVLLALFFFGGQTIHSFAEALIVGILVGTYSSVFIASPTTLALGITKEDLMPPEIEKEGEEFDAP